MKSRSIPLFYFLIISINGFFSISWTAFADPSNVIQFRLIHRHEPELSGITSGPPKTRFERIVDLIHSDNARQEMITHKFGSRRMAREIRVNGKVPRMSINSIGIPLRSAADTGAGQFFVSFRVGSPSQKFILIADTGSDLTWMNCNHGCPNCPKRRFNKRIFHADQSSSFKTIPCISRMCKIELRDSFSLSRCPAPMTPCAYDYRYSDASTAQGLFANETVTLGLLNGRKTRLHDILVGCSQTSTGGSFNTADGIMGLGYSKYSFAVRAAEAYGGKFAYCLVDHFSPLTIHSYLTFGKFGNTVPKQMQFTELITDAIPPFYAVNVGGISIGGVMLDIPANTWDVGGEGGVILDSGSSLTFLTQPAYDPVMGALSASLRKYNKVELNIGPMEFCFNSTGFNESLVPKLAFHFQDGARFEPPMKSYVIDVTHGIKCLGFAYSDFPGPCVIGNIMQQNHLWEFDLKRNKLGFITSSCTQV